MKKLLMMATVACFATMSQAITLAWSDADLTDVSWSSSSPSFSNMFVIMNSEATSGIMTAQALEQALKNVAGTELTNGWAKTDFVVAQPVYKQAEPDVYSLSSTFSSTLNDSKDLTAGQYFLFLESTDGTTLIADLGNLQGSSDWSISGGSFAGGEKSVDFMVTPVPEPTAFALIALGVAGLALRRRTK